MLRIANGRLFDPANGLNDQVRDLWIDGGRIVDAPGLPEREVETIDAAGLIVMPGGVDMHSHIAGSKVSAGRKLCPEDHRRAVRLGASVGSGMARSGSGRNLPSTFLTGYRYSEMGYTTVMEAATAPITARHAHEELNDIPLIDKGCFITMGNNHFIMERIRRGEGEKVRDYVAWLLSATRGYAVKIVNPGGVENWKWGKNVDSLDDPVIGLGVTPRQIVRNLAGANEALGLPHSIHLHTNNLGRIGNAQTTLETIRALEGARVHICHVQFSSYGGEEGPGIRSGAETVAQAVNEHRNVTVDVGQVIFGEAVTMTADGPLEHRLHRLTGNKWVNEDVEEETGGGVVPMSYKRGSFFNALQWAIGLELFLLIEDPWRVVLTTDHPNGGPFTAYPQVIRWLMDRGSREAMLSRINPRARELALLPQIRREYSLYEIAIITRAAPARILGLRNKGHLGLGADADVAIYAPQAEMETMFARPRCVIKDGQVVVRDGELVRLAQGRTFWVGPNWDRAIEGEVREHFEQYYTLSFANYPLGLEYLPRHEVVPCT